MKVVGKKVGSFLDKKTGEVVSFARLYVIYNFPEDDRKDGPKIEGICAEELKVPTEVAGKVPLDSEIRPLYNKYGKVEDVIVFDVKEAGTSGQEKTGKAG